MANLTNRSLGMLLLGIYLVLVGVTSLLTFALPPVVFAVLAIAAGVLILIGK